MKRISKSIKAFFRHILSFFDKWLITPITKLMLKIANFFKDNTKNLDRIASKKSTLIIVSLILAFGVFVIVDQESNVMIDQYAEVLYDEPVTAVYNEELYVVEGLPETVDITLIGQRRHIFLAKQAPSKGVTVDLTGLKPGNHKVTLNYSQRLKSLDYRLDPSEVTVTIYEKVSATKSLTVDILHQDELDSKLYIDNVELDRTDVIIKGAQYKLDKVATVRALVDVEEINKPKAGEITLKDVPLVAYDEEGQRVDVEIVPSTVDAKLTITSPSKEIPVKVVPTGKLAFGKSIESINTSVSTVTVYGQQDAIDKIEELEVEVDVKGLDKDKKFTVTLKKPKGITEISEKTITVDVKVANSTTKEFTVNTIEFRNLADGLSVQALSAADTTVTVSVSGSSDIVDKLDASSIVAYVDLKDYGVGEHEVEVHVEKSDLKLTYTPKTKKIRVRIS
ncbi:MAG: CdaR family protein [bacterium]|nr:CdaR family protein [Mycoplasmatota bacterium]MDD6756560.1 CdaR family protein [bacterium]MDY2908607.1 CdaR family protein [Candidatus Faecimonas sp.]